MKNLSTCLWFDTNAEEAAEYYCSIFKNSRIIQKNYYGEGAPLPAGTVLTVHFDIDGHEFVALNGGPMFKFSEAVSFVINCETQDDIDYYWDKLGDGGQFQNCGWLKDKFGLSWQVCPTNLNELFEPGDKDRLQRVMNAMMQMIKLDVNILWKAYRGE
jgi:predicted 3-demethylubiquinone-9 3-methyltransferase (glyoxalase superfamily)